ncbi:MAG: hypothetical protein HY782_11965 [Chloroflexi bacterium]|nr:hypothetical protein [Chloroflexota bacterium]
MKKRIALLAICVAGMLVVFGVLAFSVYAVNIGAPAPSAVVLDAPAAPADSATMDQVIVIGDGYDAEETANVSMQNSHWCSGDKAESASTGY